jgi:uncharacterized protein
VPHLGAEEVRVLGVLMEKHVTTPDGYPLTVNALMNGCNQSTARNPVVRYSEAVVNAALASLRAAGWTRIVYSPSNRAPKHRHVVDEVLGLSSDEQAVLTQLALRGPQTVGELKGRSERMHAFGSLDAVDASLQRLAGRSDPLVVRLPRRPGHKEERWAHLLGGPLDDAAVSALEAAFDAAEVSAEARSPRTATPAVSEERMAALEARVAELERELAAVRSLLQ